MKSAIRLFAILAITLVTLGAFCVARADESGPRAVVTAYMDALKAPDYPKALEVLGISLPPAAVDKIHALAAGPQGGAPPFRWQVIRYAIKDVRIDGGLAEITVEEVSVREADEMVKSFITQLGPFGQELRWGELKVTETFVLVRLGGRWTFDSGHSGIMFARSPVSELVAAAAKDAAPSPALQQKLAEFVNGIGIGQALQTLNTPIIPVIAAVAVPNFTRARARGQLVACKSNLKNIGTALEMYSVDNSGRYPTRLSQLTPDYLRLVPTCPAAGSDTYSEGYACTSKPDGYTVRCKGSHHEAVGYPADFPAYTSGAGLIDR